MFLLIRIRIRPCNELYRFTFHNVSINTQSRIVQSSHVYYLHSTMFLLIQRPVIPTMRTHRNLHSTMFLLIRHRGV